MTREEFIEVLEENDYSYIIDDENNGDIIVTYSGDVDLDYLGEIPSGIEFKNKGDVDLRILTQIPPGVKFNNEGNVYLKRLGGGWVEYWGCKIEGTSTNRLLNLMISKGLFI